LSDEFGMSEPQIGHRIMIECHVLCFQTKQYSQQRVFVQYRQKKFKPVECFDVILLGLLKPLAQHTTQCS